MALTNDQKAMLRLLAQREEGYEDIAALMGISVQEVRARVKDALAEMDSGRAAPTETSEASAPPEEEAAEPKAESATVTPPSASASGAGQTPTRHPGEGRTKRAARRPRPSLSGLKLPKDRGALVGLGAGVVAVIALVLVLALSGGEGGSGTTASSDGTGDGTTVAANGKELTQAILEPTDGGDASGRAIFGRFRDNVLLQVEAEGLEPTQPGESYTIWLYRSPKLVLRIGALRVDEKGEIAVQIPIPAEVLAYVASGAFGQIDISLTDDAAYKAEVTAARREKRLPEYTGTSVLRGTITGPAIKEG